MDGVRNKLKRLPLEKVERLNQIHPVVRRPETGQDQNRPDDDYLDRGKIRLLSLA